MMQEVREREQELQKSKAALYQSEKHFRTLIESASDIVAVLDAEGRIQYSSPALQPVLGYQQTDLSDRNFSDFTHPDETEAIVAAFEQTLQHQGIAPPIELRLQHKNGNWMTLEATSNNLLNDPSMQGIIVNLRDITERKRTQALQKEKETVEQASRAKSQFLANMSHELRTPLNAIIGYSEMLQEEAEDLEQADFIPDLKKIHTAGRNLLCLINDILDLSKIEAGKTDLYLEDFDVAQLIQEVVNTIQPLVNKNDNRLIVIGRENLGSMQSDLTKIRQNLLNLLSNAAKFTDQGTISLIVERFQAGELQAGVPYITFKVTDTGIGMTSEQQSRVFQAFTQADASTTRKYGGTGLGLAIAQRFCQILGGEITVESTVGQGSTFTMQLPVKAPHPEPVKPVTDLPSVSLLPELDTVLVIDDDPTVHDLMRRFLVKEGFQIQSALNADQGLRLARAIHPAAITLDVMMPGQDGWATLSTLKNDPELTDIPVVMLTMVDDKTLGYTLGASDYLTKPIDRSQLSRILGKYRCEHPPCSLLLVEDDATSREMMQQMLEKSGWTVQSAENGRVALDQLSTCQPELILLDLRMPELDGFGFVAELQKRAEWRSIPIIVITAETITPEDQRQLGDYVETVLEKGLYGQEKLLAIIRNLVATNRQRRSADRAAMSPSTDCSETQVPAEVGLILESISEQA
jgi:PAS domain S-box-containing protein